MPCKLAFKTAASKDVKLAPATTISVIVLEAAISSSLSQLANNTGMLNVLKKKAV